MGRANSYNPETAFADKWFPEPNSGCWIWVGSVNNGGYGNFWCDGVCHKAHRFSYNKFNGTIPEGMDILHKCDNTYCVNPDHLSPGTHQDNMLDMWRKGRGNPPAGVKNPKAKMDPASVAELLNLSKNQNTKSLSAHFGISVSQVRRIIRGGSW